MSGERPVERLEAALGVACGLVVLAIIGYLTFEGLTGGAVLPELTVRAGPPTGAGQLRFTLTNRGGRAATAIGLSLTLRDGERIVALHRLTVDEVPARSEVSGAFLLPPNAGALTPELAVEGYLDP